MGSIVDMATICLVVVLLPAPSQDQVFGHAFYNRWRFSTFERPIHDPNFGENIRHVFKDKILEVLVVFEFQQLKLRNTSTTH